MLDESKAEGLYSQRTEPKTDSEVFRTVRRRLSICPKSPQNGQTADSSAQDCE